MYKIKKSNWENLIAAIPQLIFLAIFIIMVAKMSNLNGRIYLCRELGGNYTNQNECVDPMLIKHLVSYGPQKEYNETKLDDVQWLNTTI